MKPGETTTVTLGGKTHTLAAGTTLAQLVDLLGHAPAGVATAINGDFVARGLRDDRVLKDDDAVLLFQPIVGG